MKNPGLHDNDPSNLPDQSPKPDRQPRSAIRSFLVGLVLPGLISGACLVVAERRVTTKKVCGVAAPGESPAAAMINSLNDLIGQIQGHIGEDDADFFARANRAFDESGLNLDQGVALCTDIKNGALGEIDDRFSRLQLEAVPLNRSI